MLWGDTMVLPTRWMLRRAPAALLYIFARQQLCFPGLQLCKKPAFKETQCQILAVRVFLAASCILCSLSWHPLFFFVFEPRCL